MAWGTGRVRPVLILREIRNSDAIDTFPRGVGLGEAGQPEGIPEPGENGRRQLAERLQAVLEVVICSGFPTQIAVAWVLALAGLAPFQPDGKLSPGYVFALSLLDAALLVALILSFLRAHGERPREVLLGERPVVGEALLGLPLAVPVFLLVVVALSVVRWLAPWMHNVPRNPLEGLIRTRLDAVAFGVVAVVGGGLREEIQRAFILRRFERHLGGGWLGVLLFSLVFGAGHTLQGWDVAIATACLGAFWGVVFLVRRSIAAPIVSHSVFNAAEIFRYTLYGP
jgi:membrane protease YdiL (CAAX protease family)